MRWARAVGVAACLVWIGLAACAEENPLLGQWQIDDERSAAGAALGLGLSGLDRIEFTEDKMITSGQSYLVRYEHEAERVIVTHEKQGEGKVFRLLGDERIQMEAPAGITIVYRRVAPAEGS